MPTSKSEIHTSGGGKEGAVSRFFLAPLAFLSFILSLALIDSRNHYLRIANREPSSLGIIQRARRFLHGLVFKRVDQGPYGYVESPDALDGSSGSPNAGVKEGRASPGKRDVGAKRGKPEGDPWHWHTQQRKMMKREFDDAFEMRNSVAVAIVAVLLGGLLGIVGVVGWIWGFIVGRFGG